MNGTDLATESGVRSAVVVSLFTDRRAANDDVLPDGTYDRRGCWMDQYEDHLKGSRLWLLSREKELPDVLHRAREYSEEALQWMIDKSIVLSVSATAEWAGRGILALHIVIMLPNNTQFEDVFNYPLQAA